MGVNLNIKYKDRKKEYYKDSTKEERAQRLGNVICTRCGDQNHYFYAKKYGRCNLCKATIDADYFKKTLLRRLNNG